MSGWSRQLGSSVGLKLLMAASGALLVLFVLGHMLGNLQVFLGPEALNAYAGKLQGLGGLLWLVRAGLLAVCAVHVATGLLLWWRNRAARPQAYAVQTPLASTLASRTMVVSGLLVLVFLGFHLLHFTLHVTHPGHVARAGEHADVYRMVVLGFQDPAVALSYAAAMALLYLHLSHGIASLFQSLGWNEPRHERLTRGLGRVLSVLLLAGNVAMPLAVLAGWVGLPGGVA